MQMVNEEFSGIWFLRETRALRDWLETRNSRLISSEDVDEFLVSLRPSPWVDVLRDGVTEYREETGGAENPVDHYVEWLAEWGRDMRRRQQALLLLTAHRVKGLEFDHVVVLDGNWQGVSENEDRDAPRRLYYVAMTRARKTLTLARMPVPHPFQDALKELLAVLRRTEQVGFPPPGAELSRSYRRLSLQNVFLSFAGYRKPDDPVHEAIAALSPGDNLGVRMGRRGRWELLNSQGRVVGRLAGSYRVPDGMRIKFASVMATGVDPTVRTTKRPG